MIIIRRKTCIECMKHYVTLENLFHGKFQAVISLCWPGYTFLIKHSRAFLSSVHFIGGYIVIDFSYFESLCLYIYFFAFYSFISSGHSFVTITAFFFEFFMTHLLKNVTFYDLYMYTCGSFAWRQGLGQNSTPAIHNTLSTKHII